MSRLRLAVVGCGLIRITLCNARQRLPEEAEIAAVCDEIPERARVTGERHSFPFYTSLEEMIEKAEFDVLNVCTPSGLHDRHGILGANAGKHVVCEKPIDVNLEAADALIGA